MANILNGLTLFVSKLLLTQNEFDEIFEQMKNDNNNSSNTSFSGMGNHMWIFFVVFGVAFVIIVTSIIASVVKSRKKTGDLVDVVKTKLKENTEKEKTKNICSYCGTRLKDDENRCPSCGAQRKN